LRETREDQQALRLGAHMPIDGGIHRAVERAAGLEATALQVFVKSARQWRPRALEPEEIESFRTGAAERGLAPYTLAHASYLTNPATPNPALRERSIAALRVEMERCGLLGISFLVLHPGSHVGAGERTGLERVVRALDRVTGTGGPAAGVKILLETTAGQGTNLGNRFEHLAWILERVRDAGRFGVCFDTCHAFAAGYDLRDDRTYDETFHGFDRTVGIDRLEAFHLNDSKHPLGSRKDRHEHIGRGEIGVGTFGRIVNDPRFRGIPMILETPKGPDLAEDRQNLKVLRGLVRQPGAGRR
jgi:deoxyribonuclease-4